MLAGAQIGERDDDEKTRHSQCCQDVEQFRALKIDQKEDNQRQTENPREGDRAALLNFCSLNSLTHELWNRHSHWQHTQRAGADVSKNFRDALWRQRANGPHIDYVVCLKHYILFAAFLDRVIVELQVL